MNAPTLRTRPTTQRPGLGLLALVLGAAACGGSEPAAAGGLTRAEFVDVVVAVRQAELDGPADVDQDSADVLFEERKDSILAAHGVTEADLERFLAAHADVDFQDALWDTITQRLKRPIRDPAVYGPAPDTAPNREPDGLERPVRPDPIRDPMRGGPRR